NLKQLESECADVAFDFVQVVFRDALLLIGSLPGCQDLTISNEKSVNFCLPECFATCCADVSLEQEHSLSFSQYSAYRKVFGLGTMLNGTGRVPPSSKPDIRVTSPCLSNEERVYFPDESVKTARASQTNQKSRRSDAQCASQSGSSGSPGFYGRGCDVRANRSEAAAAIRRVCCDAMKQLTAQPSWPRNRHSNQRDRRRGDQAMAIPTIETEMKLNALIISRLVSQDASVSSVDADSTVLNLRRQQNHYQLQHQNLGYFNPASYNTLTSQVTNLSTIVSTSAVPANNRTDSGVYEDPQEPPAGDPSETPPAAAPAAAAAASPDRAKTFKGCLSRRVTVAKLLPKSSTQIP
uniref:Rho-GAP domain-containing protein n=1 Tax=Macrostomum lignano TaxID=282301 RepID=A0A1I8FR75_9PLAT